MTMSRTRLQHTVFTLFAGLLAAAGPVAKAQDQPITPTALDDAAVGTARRSALHPMPTNNPAAARAKESAHFPGPTTTPFQNGKPRFPGDMSYQGGAFLDHAQSHAVYLLNPRIGCINANCWGNPEAFLRDLGQSDFIHVADEYVKRHDNNRYTNGAHANVTVTTLPHKLTDSNVLAIVHAVASQTHLTGYNHIYHVFIPPGTDECADNTLTQCYSPDVPASFAFCAYHSSVDFRDIGHVLYTVEPFQNVPGCNIAAGSPNGPVVDGTTNVLSHELFETITDPDGDGWWNTASNDLFGDELADECSFVIFLPAGGAFDPPAFNIGGKRYAVQAEYDNSSHACVTKPGDN